MRILPGLPLDKFDIHAVGLTTRKRLGEAAEAAFLAKASGLGFGVAKPWGDSERYDFLLDSGHGDFWRVQVKSTQRYAESRYRVKAAGWKATYTRDEIDFLVAWIIPENLWYVVPIHAFASRKGLRFYPHGGRKALYEKYREAWCLMACPRSAQIDPAQIEPAQTDPTQIEPACARPSQSLASCRCEQLSVRCALCPLRPQ
jgi:PD-(D/E)XK endonuclease